MKPFNTSQRLKQIMRERGIKQVDIVTAARPYCEKYGVNLGKNTLSQYVSGKTEPKQDKLSILGMALGVSEAWLMGYDVPMEPVSVQPDTLQSDESELLGLYRGVTDQGQTLILGNARMIAGMDEYKR